MSASKHASPNHALRDAREQRGWSRDHVATLLGTNPFTVYRWESGRAFPNRYYRQRLSEVFGCGPELLGLLPASTRTPLFLSIVPARAEGAVPVAASSDGSWDGAEPLVGRHHALAFLKKQLGAPHPSQPGYLALHGLPGVGKTALAAALAADEEVRQHFCDGIIWIELGPQPELGRILACWAHGLGLTSTEAPVAGSKEGLLHALVAAMSRRRMLIVLDDVWSLAESIELHVAGPGCSYLLTTRLPVLAADYAPRAHVALPELQTDEGLLLLERLAPAAVQLERELVQELVQAVSGLPLALVAMGHYLYLQGTSGQPRRLRAAIAQLQQRRQRLSLPLPQRPYGTGIPISLQSAIAVSVARLSAPAAGLLQRLAGFPPKPDTFSEEEASANSQMSDSLCFGCLDELCDAGLLESCAPEMYTLHPTIADYMLEYGEGYHVRSAREWLVPGPLLLSQT